MSKHQAETISIMALLVKFSTERKAVAWLEKRVWGGKPRCGHCGCADKVSTPKSKPFHYWCGYCRKHFTVKTNSVMGASKIPTRKWVVAIYYMLTARKGISSLQLSKELGITQKSAWFMVQRIRAACKGNEFGLDSEVEADETYIGGKERNKHQNKRLKIGQGGAGKQAVLGMRERRGRAKAIPISGHDGVTLQTVIESHVAPGATVYTDEHSGYRHLKRLYQHQRVNHSANEYVSGMAHTNGIESVWAVLKRGIHGTYHHVSVKHLRRYLDEFTFRLNEGNVKVDTLDRMSALCANIKGNRLTYKELIK